MCAWFCESLPSCAGQLLLPRSYLSRCYALVRAAGGVCVADEVQSGLGRNGVSWWEFQRHGVEPDVVTLGKGLGGGSWPLAAVVTRPHIAQALMDTGVEHFNTSAATNVAGAVGSAVLQVLAEERRMEGAAHMGRLWMAGLQRLQTTFPHLIADVRGIGLFIGVEMATSRRTEEGEQEETPAPALASELVRRVRCMEDRLADGRAIAGVLLSTDGPHLNVIKIKPPLTHTQEDVQCALRCIERGLVELHQRRLTELHHPDEIESGVVNTPQRSPQPPSPARVSSFSSPTHLTNK